MIVAQAYLNLDISPGVWLATLAAAATAALPLWYWRSARYEAALNMAIAAVGVQFVLLVTAVVPKWPCSSRPATSPATSTPAANAVPGAGGRRADRLAGVLPR